MGKGGRDRRGIGDGGLGRKMKRRKGGKRNRRWERGKEEMRTEDGKRREWKRGKESRTEEYSIR